MTTHPNATAPGGVLGLRLWTQPLEALATRGGVLAVGRYFRIKANTDPRKPPYRPSAKNAKGERLQRLSPRAYFPTAPLQTHSLVAQNLTLDLACTQVLTSRAVIR